MSYSFEKCMLLKTAKRRLNAVMTHAQVMHELEQICKGCDKRKNGLCEYGEK